jgi:hypothetical protein
MSLTSQRIFTVNFADTFAAAADPAGRFKAFSTAMSDWAAGEKIAAPEVTPASKGVDAMVVCDPEIMAQFLKSPGKAALQSVSNFSSGTLVTVSAPFTPR